MESSRGRRQPLGGQDTQKAGVGGRYRGPGGWILEGDVGGWGVREFKRASRNDSSPILMLEDLRQGVDGAVCGCLLL